MLHILAVADRGLISHAQAFQTRKAAERGLVRYLRKNEGYKGADDMDSAQRWLEEHDERLSVEIIEQTGGVGAGDSMTVLRHIYDLLYLDLNKNREFYNAEKAWDADTLTAIADIVRPLFPKLATRAAEAAEDELTPKDRAEFVRRIERVSPYDEGLDAKTIWPARLTSSQICSRTFGTTATPKAWPSPPAIARRTATTLKSAGMEPVRQRPSSRYSRPVTVEGGDVTWN